MNCVSRVSHVSIAENWDDCSVQRKLKKMHQRPRVDNNISVIMLFGEKYREGELRFTG